MLFAIVASPLIFVTFVTESAAISTTAATDNMQRGWSQPPPRHLITVNPLRGVYFRFAAANS